MAAGCDPLEVPGARGVALDERRVGFAEVLDLGVCQRLAIGAIVCDSCANPGDDWAIAMNRRANYLVGSWPENGRSRVDLGVFVE
ncbi:MAG: hypothetical protein ACI89X_003695 [Planctomycetota bacterium]|jgi:hypothetical protein